MTRRYAAEFCGTFGIVFATVALAAGGGMKAGGGLMAGAWVAGLTVLAMIYTFGPISAAHFNPAVTLGFAVAGRFPWRFVPAYAMAQLSGAVAAAGLVHLLLGSGGALVPRENVALWRAVTLEGILTLFLMLTILAVATDRRVSGAVPGTAIGLLVVANVLVGGPVTGAGMNPVRWFGTAVFAGDITLPHLWVYIVGPILGASTAALLYEAVLRPSREYACGAPNDLYEAMREVRQAAAAAEGG